MTLMSETDVLEDLRYLFDEFCLHNKDPVVPERQKSRTSLDDGYVSSREEELDSGRIQDPAGLVDPPAGVAVLRRGPTRPRHDQARHQPYMTIPTNDEVALPWGLVTPSSPPKPMAPQLGSNIGAVEGGWIAGSPESQLSSPRRPSSADSASWSPSGVLNWWQDAVGTEIRDALSSTVLPAIAFGSLSLNQQGGHQQELTCTSNVVAPRSDAAEVVPPSSPSLPSPRVDNSGNEAELESLIQYLMQPPEPLPVVRTEDIDEALNHLGATLAEQPSPPDASVLPVPVEEINNTAASAAAAASPPRRYTPILPRAAPSVDVASPAVVVGSPRNVTAFPRDPPLRAALKASQTVLSLNKAHMMVRQLCQQGSLSHRAPEDGKTYLHQGLALSDVPLVLKLVEHLEKYPGHQHALGLDMQDAQGLGPLHYACMVDHPELVGFLCEAGARADLCSITGYLPLHLAAERGFLACVSQLLKAPWAPSLDHRDNKGRTALQVAVLSHGRRMEDHNRTGQDQDHTRILDCTQVIKELICHGASLTNQDIAGQTALHNAVYLQKLDLVNLLLHLGSETEALVRCKDGKGDTALHLACAAAHQKPSQQEALVQLLVSNGAPRHDRNNQGHCPADLLSPGRPLVRRWLEDCVTPQL